ncbi:MAG: ABC transporter ATP-binding protein [Clostridia bacterium]|nr:ABC transporter ATP-binding protein [Clostridia bacterium]
MKRLLKYLKSYKKECVLGPLFKMFEATLELIVPLVIAAIVDKGIGNESPGFIVKACLFLLLLGAVGLGFSLTAQYFSAKAAVGFVGKLRYALFEKVGTLSYSDIDELGTSTLITRMTQDASKVQSGLNLTLRLLLRSPFVVFGAMIMAFTVDVRSALNFAAVIPLLSIVVFGIMLITMPLYKKAQKGTDKLLGRTRENLSGVRVIRAFRHEDEECDAFKGENDVLTAVQRRVGRISALMNPMTYVLINVAILLLIHTGAIEVKHGNLTQGEVVALYNYMSQILVELIKLANLIISITKAMASASRIADVLDINPTENMGTLTVGKHSDVAVEFKNASLIYSGSSEPSLENITFSAKRGETIGIIGGTGSGKTSLINMIGAFYKATSGEVLVDGIEVSEYSRDALRAKIGVVPQAAVLFNGTIRENMLWGNDGATDEEIAAAVHTAQATDVVESKGGLDAMIEQGGKNLSGGQKQRLTIARALVRRPEILILDDSASALDYATDAALRSAIKDIDGNTTVFIVSQRASSIMHADKIIVLDDGSSVGIGTHEELLSSCPVYREIYATQFSEVQNG